MTSVGRRGFAGMAALVCAALVATSAPAGATATASGTAGYWRHCPTAESLVSGTHWTTRHLAPGVLLREGLRRDARGYVRMHVLTADVTNPHLAFRPLMNKISSRRPLSAMARPRHKLVAVTNAGYFDWGSSSPIGPVVNHGHALLAAGHRQAVVGFGHNGRMQAGNLTLTGHVSARGRTEPLAGLNLHRPADGLTAYTPRWGVDSLRMPPGAHSRYVRHGHVATAFRRFRRAPHSGYLLVARGRSDLHWLHSLHRGTRVRLSRHVTTDAAHTFRVAYAVGTQLVLPGGWPRTHMVCRRSYPQPARTVVGFADGGRRLILAVVDDNYRTRLHGLDANQLARVMADLGADQAFLLDGGGSTELLARMARHHRLSLRNRPTDGRERPLPLGFAIYRR